MNVCRFCHKTLKNRQAFVAHTKYCRAYQNSRRGIDDGLRGDPSLSPQPGPSFNVVDNQLQPNPLEIFQVSMKQMESIASRQRHEGILQRARARVVEYALGIQGTITAEMRAAACVAVTDVLRPLPLEELPFDEVVFRAEAVRDRLWQPHFDAQQHTLEQERQEAAQRRSREAETLDRLRRTARRRATLLEQGVAMAKEKANAAEVPYEMEQALLVEVRCRLEAVLTGDESEREIGEVFDAVIPSALLDMTCRLKAAQRARRNRMLDQLVTHFVPVIEMAWPWARKKLVHTLGQWMRPTASPASQAEDIQPGAAGDFSPGTKEERAPHTAHGGSRHAATTPQAVKNEVMPDVA